MDMVPADLWEMHPHGDEVVVCTAGTMALHQETALFITSGEATTHRPR